MKLSSKTFLVIIATIVMIGTSPVLAQDEHEKRDKHSDRKAQFEKMKSMKIAYITEHLDLTPGEAEKFWPIYNEYEKKRDEAAIGIFKQFNPGEEKRSELSDEDADKLIRKRFAEEQALLDLKKEYYAKYTQVLPASKIFKLYDVENMFKRHLLERVREGRGESRGERSSEGGSRAKPYGGRR